MATYVASKLKNFVPWSKRWLFVLKDLTLFKFGSDFPKHLALIEVLRLNDNRLYDTPVNLKTCNLANVPNFLMCLFVKTICMA